MEGGGFWQPDATTLAKLRRDIDRKPHKFKAVLTDAGIREAFLGGVKDDEKKAVKAFTSLSLYETVLSDVGHQAGRRVSIANFLQGQSNFWMILRQLWRDRVSSAAWHRSTPKLARELPAYKDALL